MVLVDEVHMFPKDGNGRYKKLLQRLRELNPKVKLVGFTATPYRTASGLLTEGEDRIFTDLVYEVGIEQLIDQGYLSPLQSKVSKIQPNLSHIGKQNGDYVLSELQDEMMKDEIKLARTMDEILRYGSDRKSWIIFCTGVEHAEMVSTMLTGMDITNACITGDTPKDERDVSLQRFKARELRCLVNCNVLTTGFNAPNIDLLAMLRPTQSPGLYVQMVGRGSRLCDGKKDCLILDFSRNIHEHGPITEVVPPHLRKEKKDPAIKVCPNCEGVNKPRALECTQCGAPFPEPEKQDVELKHSSEPEDVDIMGKSLPRWIVIDRIFLGVHRKKDKPTSLRVEYSSITESVKEWVCVNHTGFAHEKAREWLTARGLEDMLRTTQPFIECDCGHLWGELKGSKIVCAKCNQEQRKHDLSDPNHIVHNLVMYHRWGKVPVPKTILAKKEGQFDRIMRCEYEDEKDNTPIDIDDEITY